MSDNPFKNNPANQPKPEPQSPPTPTYDQNENPYAANPHGQINPSYLPAATASKPSMLGFVTITGLVLGLMGALSNLTAIGMPWVQELMYSQMSEEDLERVATARQMANDGMLLNMIFGGLSFLVSVCLVVGCMRALKRKGRSFLRNSFGAACLIVLARTLYGVYFQVTNVDQMKAIMKEQMEGQPGANQEALDMMEAFAGYYMIFLAILTGVIGLALVFFHFYSFNRLGKDDVVEYFEGSSAQPS